MDTTEETVTLDQARECHPLAPAVIDQLGGGDDCMDDLRNVLRGGADGGFHGFIYNDECRDFVRANKTAIKSALAELADGIGSDSIVSLVKGFNCLKDGYTEDEIGSVLYGDGSDAGDSAGMIYSALAWFALEEVANSFEAVQA